MLIPDDSYFISNYHPHIFFRIDQTVGTHFLSVGGSRSIEAIRTFSPTQFAYLKSKPQEPTPPFFSKSRFNIIINWLTQLQTIYSPFFFPHFFNVFFSLFSSLFLSHVTALHKNLFLFFLAISVFFSPSFSRLLLYVHSPFFTFSLNIFFIYPLFVTFNI